MNLEAIIDAIDAKLDGPGRDQDRLSRAEHAFMLAYGFDDHIRGQGFTSFVFERDRDEWIETRDALNEVGAINDAEVLGRFIKVDGDLFLKQGALPPGSPEFHYSEDYDAGLRRNRARAGVDDALYMHGILTAYARQKGIVAP